MCCQGFLSPSFPLSFLPSPIPWLITMKRYSCVLSSASLRERERERETLPSSHLFVRPRQACNTTSSFGTWEKFLCEGVRYVNLRERTCKWGNIFVAS